MSGIFSTWRTKIYRYLLKHPRLDALQCYIRNCKDIQYCRKVACRDSLVLTCEQYGKLNKDKNIFLIKHGSSELGFFALFRELLKYLCYADRFGFYPVIEWEKGIPYAESDEICGTTNPFEYYFEQPAGISLEETKKSYNVFKSEEVQLDDFFVNKELPEGENGYIMSDELIDYFAVIMQKYIRFQPTIERDLKEHVQNLFQGQKVLGVHYRGTDYKSNFSRHPVFVQANEYLAETKQMYQEGNYDRVFLATDDLETVEIFRDEFKDRLVFYEDVERTTGTVSVAFIQNEREHHKYMLGYEVLRDMYTLSECDGLLAGISQVSYCAQIRKKSTGKNYHNLKVINAGINHNNTYFVTPKRQK
ncbi:MAG: O-fucosyltransferase family protein [Lachnospiraceae bacterium]|nr:O-fucosyltransferase family protein [Lachnospiraceae bacterium]